MIMLSAIAARKAIANAASASTSSAPIPSPPAPTNTLPKPIIKRKRSQVALSDINKSSPSSSTSTKKRRKDASKKLTKQPRYFEPRVPETDEFRGQDDVIVLGDDKDSDSEDIEVEIPSIKENKSKRSYSPSRPILDDSSEEEEEGEKQHTVVSSGNHIQEHSLLTTVVPVDGQNLFYLTAEEVSTLTASSHSATLIALKPSNTLTLLGTYRLTVIRGSVEVAGAILLQGSQHNVFAPRSSPLPCIRALSTSPAPSASIPHRLQTAVTEDDIVVLLQELCTGVEGLGKVCRTFEGVFGVHPRDVLNRAEEGIDVLRLKGVQLITQNSRYISPLSMPPSWTRALDEIYSASADAVDDVEIEDGSEGGEGIEDPLPNIYLVKGPKKIGKSSFARALVNRLLSRYHRVAYLECDLGQSEFTPGGIVALNVIDNPLLGPPFTHPTIPIRAHFLGAFSPKTSPGHYVDAVKDLVEYWGREFNIGVDSDFAGLDSAPNGRKFSTVPLVVNTMGWAKGLGADLSRKVEDILSNCLSTSLASLAYGLSSKMEKSGMHVYELEYEDEWAGGHRVQKGLDNIQIHPPPSRTHSFSFFGHGAGYTPSFSSPQKIHIHRIEPAPIHGFTASGTTSSTAATALNNFSAADHRVLNILSYFHAVFPSSIPSSSPISSQLTAAQWDTSLPLLARPPYQVDVATAVDRVILLPSAGAEEIVESEIERVLGGAVVGLVLFEPGMLDSDIQSLSSEKPSPKTKIPYSPPSSSSPSSPSYPSPSNSSALGIALVRSVVPGGSHLHVLTPLPPALCSSTRVLVKGEMEIPVWGLIDHRKDGRDDKERDTPFLQWDKGTGLGAEKRRVRRNLMRKGQGV